MSLPEKMDETFVTRSHVSSSKHSSKSSAHSGKASVHSRKASVQSSKKSEHSGSASVHSSQASGRSNRSTASTAATKARAKAQAAQAEIAFAEKEANIMREKAGLEAETTRQRAEVEAETTRQRAEVEAENARRIAEVAASLHVLQIQKAAVVASAEADVYEAAAEAELEVCAVDVLHPAEPQTRKDFLQYSCPLSLDVNTINKQLSLSEEKRKVTKTQQQPYPNNAERFVVYTQVLCTEGLSERRYWEVERSGDGTGIAVCYKDTGRGTPFGDNDKSWCLGCYGNDYRFRHNSVDTTVLGPVSSRVGVYLDHKAGTLSFYSVSDTMTLLHTVQTTFTQPLYPGIWLWHYGDTAELCKTW